MNLTILDVSYDFNGIENTIHPVVISNKKEKILIDCGYPGFLPQLQKAAVKKNSSLHDLTGILITHHDVDHIGALGEFKIQYPTLKIYSPEPEESYINGDKESLRLAQAEAVYQALPRYQKGGALQFMKMLRKVAPVKVDHTFNMDDEFPVMRGVRIISTPGHMPGHVSVYLENSKTLIASDALVYKKGKFGIANPNFTLDLPEAIESVKKLSRLQPDKVICYHGGLVESGVKRKLDALAKFYN